MTDRMYGPEPENRIKTVAEITGFHTLPMSTFFYLIYDAHDKCNGWNFYDEYHDRGITMKKIFAKFHEDFDSLNINLAADPMIYKTKIIEWMIDNQFINEEDYYD